jgi:hypothetical protein
MELQEFTVAVEELVGEKFTPTDLMEYSIITEKFEVSIRKKFLGGPDVWVNHAGSFSKQPGGEDLADAFRRVQQAFERAHADWPLYEEYAANALKEFQEYVKMPIDVVKGVRQCVPGYMIMPKGIAVELFWITCDASGEAMNGHSSLRRHMSSKMEEPGIYALELGEYDNVLRVRGGGGRRDELAAIVKCENVKVSIRRFEILPEILNHTSTSEDRQELPEIEGYNRITRRQEYTFLEFEVL